MTRDELEAVLDTFQWGYPDRSANRGEVTVDEDGETLLLTVWTHDNQSTDEHVHPLEVRQDIDWFSTPERVIRDLIHGYLTHEADEQMWFGEEQPFYPHEEASR